MVIVAGGPWCVLDHENQKLESADKIARSVMRSSPRLKQRLTVTAADGLWYVFDLRLNLDALTVIRNVMCSSARPKQRLMAIAAGGLWCVLTLTIKADYSNTFY